MLKKITAERLALRTVKPEYRNYRDLRINNLHRTWGREIAATDVDFLEYSRGKAKAIIDMKESDSWKSTFKENGWKSENAQLDLANRAGLPFFIVEYNTETHDYFNVVPMNAHARKIIPTEIAMNEEEYINFQYKLRDPRNDYTLTKEALTEQKIRRVEALRRN